MRSCRKSFVVVFFGVLLAALLVSFFFAWMPWLTDRAKFPEPISKDLLWGIDEKDLIPGTSVFREYFDKGHGVAFIKGTFVLPEGDQVTVRCWSPGKIARARYFDILLGYSGYGGMPPPGTTGIQVVKIKAVDFNATFDATKDMSDLWISDVSREQLRQMSKAHEAMFDVGNGKTIILHEEQLAQIQNLIAYTDKLPESTF